MKFPKVDMSDEEACSRILIGWLHPGWPRCPRCRAEGRIRNHRDHPDPWRVQYQCERCGCYFNAWTKTRLQGTHRPPSQILRIMKGIVERKSTRQLGRELGCDRGSLALFRRRIQSWVVSIFGPPKKIHEKPRLQMSFGTRQLELTPFIQPFSRNPTISQDFLERY